MQAKCHDLDKKGLMLIEWKVGMGGNSLLPIHAKLIPPAQMVVLCKQQALMMVHSKMLDWRDM
jgi:hypothetical protein